MWEVVGYEKATKNDGSISYTVYATKPFKAADGCEGKKARRVWYRAQDISYVPVVGDVVIIETEMHGKFESVVDIWVA